MARRKKIIIRCPVCGKEKEYWVAESALELNDIAFCNSCGESFNRKGEIVLYNSPYEIYGNGQKRGRK